MYNVVLVSGVQQSDSVTYVHLSILFQIIFPFRKFLLVKRTTRLSEV